MLLDREARSATLDADPAHGLLREPLLKVPKDKLPRGAADARSGSSRGAAVAAREKMTAANLPPAPADPPKKEKGGAFPKRPRRSIISNEQNDIQLSRNNVIL